MKINFHAREILKSSFKSLTLMQKLFLIQQAGLQKNNAYD